MENVKVLPGDSLDSDHRLIVARVKVQKMKRHLGKRRKIIKVEAMKDQVKKGIYGKNK